ncbi:hypothetical protein BJX70DRAFT_72524 [Aspergillus crustosus]
MPSFTLSDSATKQKYPLTLPELSRANLTLLIEVLTTGRPQDISPHYSNETSDQIQKLIKKLPSELRKRFSVLLLHSAFIPVTTTLCTTHRGLSPYIISDISRLLRLEVEDHLAQIDKWNKDPLDPRVQDALVCLRSLRGLWTDYTSHSQPLDEKRVNYQQNKCDACIISRVITNPKYLENIRAALQSRTRTKCKHRVPKLCRLIEHALGRFDIGTLQQMFEASSEIGRGLKEARKIAACEKHSHASTCKRACTSGQRNNDADKGKGKGEDEDEEDGGDKDEAHPQQEPIPYRQTPDSNAITTTTPIRPRRPSSMTVFFCIAPELRHPRRTAEDLENLDEDAAQDQLIYDIINAYNTCIPEDGEADILDPDLPEIQPLLNRSSKGAVDGEQSASVYEYDWSETSRLSLSGPSEGSLSEEQEQEQVVRPGRPVDEGLENENENEESQQSGRDSSGRRDVCRVTVEVYSESEYSASYSVDEDGVDEDRRRARSRDTRWSWLWNEAESGSMDSN